MAIYLNDFSIESFRGIRNLQSGALNHINLIVGDNNCGKTSVLESLLLFRNPRDFSNVLRIARLRDSSLLFYRSSPYESLVNLFPQDFDDGRIAVAAHCCGRELHLSLSGQRRVILLDESDLKSYFLHQMKLPSEAEAFAGSLEFTMDGHTVESHQFQFHEFSRTSGMNVRADTFLKMVYLSPVDHMAGNLINSILRNGSYKDICIRVLQLFDPDISGLVILKNVQTGRPMEYIEHKRLGTMPISTYGDGIKKVLLLANAIARAAGGVLLIDEVETAIHSKYYENIFGFLLKACIQYDVQLFITTHSMEALDALLATQNYDMQGQNDNITVMTLKKLQARTAVRSMPGREVKMDRDSFGFEVRL